MSNDNRQQDNKQATATVDKLAQAIVDKPATKPATDTTIQAAVAATVARSKGGFKTISREFKDSLDDSMGAALNRGFYLPMGAGEYLVIGEFNRASGKTIDIRTWVTPLVNVKDADGNLKYDDVTGEPLTEKKKPIMGKMKAFGRVHLPSVLACLEALNASASEGELK